MWDKVAKFLGGSIGSFAKDVSDIADKFIRTKDEKAEFKKALIELKHKQETEGQRFSLKAEHEFNQRIKDMEGTASDLQHFWLGKAVLFCRGLQRPMWGFFVMFLDWKVFAGDWTIKEGSKTEMAFFIINFLVLGFLFGERAVKNVGPLIAQLFGKK